ncbi:uncharacterized protein FIBRA_03422 [Fibroporia radiculosa]|uniref:TauD/TfdA-like domain-containing protein n=1 Tax=Fibroporia radiculosa TaxID=599839 RepID=J4HVZ5_9APHY|nr:uncharacterized protein FIBRA_03422 [Fibroporia radiculosa]CCM01372.1 predicted protein [Fibroporia radiculosa]
MLSLLRSTTLRQTLRARRIATDARSGLSYKGLTFPYRWLRDSCQCSACVHPSTRQKLHRTSDVPEDIQPTAIDGVHFSDSGVRINWTNGHQSHYPDAFLELYGSPERLHVFHSEPAVKQWDIGTLRSSQDLFLPYSSIKTSSGLLSAINQFLRYGLVFVTGVPNDKTSNEECELRALAQRFGEIRETFYGQTWDVKNVRNSRNIAYTNIDLGLHMDLLYFQHPPRLQILHCLRNRVSGGTSIFVDALYAASRLKTMSPDDFNILASTPVEFHYINDGHHLHYAHPTIELAPPSSTAPGDIRHINYSPPFQAPLPLSTPTAFYSALERFVALLEDPAARFEYTLREGDAVLFDNRRVLHARTAFRDLSGDGKGTNANGATNRWLKGCYLEADAILDRGRVLQRGA